MVGDAAIPVSAGRCARHVLLELAARAGSNSWRAAQGADWWPELDTLGGKSASGKTGERAAVREHDAVNQLTSPVRWTGLLCKRARVAGRRAPATLATGAADRRPREGDHVQSANADSRAPHFHGQQTRRSGCRQSARPGDVVRARALLARRGVVALVTWASAMSRKAASAPACSL